MWQAFVESSPEQFFVLAEKADPDSLLFGLAELVNRFPERSNGLDHWERQLIEAIARNPGRPLSYVISSIIFGDLSDGPRHSTLQDSVYELSDSGLLEETPLGDSELSPHFQHPHLGQIQSTVEPEYYRVTELGDEVLRGKRNRVDVAGFDMVRRYMPH